VEVRECEVAIDPNRDWGNTQGRMCSRGENFCFVPRSRRRYTDLIRSGSGSSMGLVRWESERGRASRARSQRPAPAFTTQRRGRRMTNSCSCS